MLKKELRNAKILAFLELEHANGTKSYCIVAPEGICYKRTKFAESLKGPVFLFEELEPLQKIEVIKSSKVIYVENEEELSAYFSYMLKVLRKEVRLRYF